MQVKHTEFDFTSGAGQSSDSNKSKVQNENAIQPIQQTQADVSGGEVNANDTEIGAVNQPSMRQSARTAGKQLKYEFSFHGYPKPEMCLVGLSILE